MVFSLVTQDGYLGVTNASKSMMTGNVLGIIINGPSFHMEQEQEHPMTDMLYCKIL